VQSLRSPVDGPLFPPRLVDWSLAVLVAFETVSGVFSLGAGHESGRLLFVAHSVAGLVLVVLLFVKLRRVRRRVTDSRLWDRATIVSVATAAVAVGALTLGVLWVVGVTAPWLPFGWTLLNVHIGLGLLLVPLLLVHVAARFRPPRKQDVTGRRTALRYAGLLVGGAVAYRLQQSAVDVLGTVGSRRRFTGSRPVDTDGDGTADPNAAFPVTSWVADDPDPVDPDSYRLRVDGLVARPGALPLDAVVAADERRALLDCTSGWYTVQDWRGRRLGDVLEAAGVGEEARWVTVHSVTGYRWSFPLAEAREMLLATHVGGSRLSHGHGYPLRLVAPDRRGFQWVKWVDRVEVRRRRDAAQYLATLVSGFT
jgi:DMSO/TMAO reductase YedYZ molybdopterin-dependent catalytic subunit